MKKSFAKTASWLVVSGILIASSAFYECGSFWIAVKAAFWACLLKTPVFYVHEIVWERKKRLKLQKRISLPVVCFCQTSAK